MGCLLLCGCRCACCLLCVTCHPYVVVLGRATACCCVGAFLAALFFNVMCLCVDCCCMDVAVDVLFCLSCGCCFCWISSCACCSQWSHGRCSCCWHCFYCALLACYAVCHGLPQVCHCSYKLLLFWHLLFFNTKLPTRSQPSKIMQNSLTRPSRSEARLHLPAAPSSSKDQNQTTTMTRAIATHKAYSLKTITIPSASSTVRAVNRPAMPSTSNTNKMRALRTYMPHMHSNLFNAQASLHVFNF